MRKRQLLQRPDNFLLDYDHELAKNLIFAGLGKGVGSSIYRDSSRYNKRGILTTMTPSSDWVYSSQLERFALKFNDTGKVVGEALSGNASIYTISLWAQRNTIVDGYSAIIGGTVPYKDAVWAYENGMIGFGDAGASWSNWGTGTWLDKTRFHHLAFVVSANDISISTRLYFDGIDKGLSVGTLQAHGIFDSITLGCLATDHSFKWVGQISDVLIHRSMLSHSAIQKLANPFDPMLGGMLLPPKRKIFPGYTLPDTSITISAVRQRPYKTRTKRPDDFIVDQNHYLANGLIFAGCGRSPGSATYVDSSIYQTNGILTTMTPTIDWVWDDQIGQWVLEFDGSDDYVSVLSTPSFRLSGDKSLCCWVKMPSLSTGCGFTGKSNSTVYGMALGYGWNGNGFMALCWNSTNNPFIIRDATRDYEWCHLSAVQHGSTRYLYVWDRWGLRSQSHGTGTHSWDHADPFRIGDAGSQKPPAGTKIGSVLVYNRALSLAETKVLSNPYDPMIDGLLRPAKRRIFASYNLPSTTTPETPTIPTVSNKAIIKRIRKKLIERPESFTLDYSHSLAQGLKFAGLQQIPGSELYTDSSTYHIPSKLINSTIVYNWIYDAILKRMILQLDGINDFVDITIPPIISAPCSIVGWFNVPSASTIYTIAGVSDYDNPSTDNHILFELSRGTLGRVAASTWNVTGAYAVSNDAFTANTWFHGAAVFGSSTNRVAYLNGKPGSVETTNLAAVAVDRGQLGCNRINTTSLYRLFSGRMTDILFYNRALSLSEIQQLSDPANIMLSGMLREPKRQYYAVPSYNPPVVDTIRPMSFLRLSSYNRRSVFLWKR